MCFFIQPLLAMMRILKYKLFSYDADDTGDVTSSDLHEIESDDEWNMVQGVLNTFLDDDRLSGK